MRGPGQTRRHNAYAHCTLDRALRRFFTIHVNRFCTIVRETASAPQSIHCYQQSSVYIYIVIACRSSSSPRVDGWTIIRHYFTYTLTELSAPPANLFLFHSTLWRLCTPFILMGQTFAFAPEHTHTHTIMERKLSRSRVFSLHLWKWLEHISVTRVYICLYIRWSFGLNGLDRIEVFSIDPWREIKTTDTDLSFGIWLNDEPSVSHTTSEASGRAGGKVCPTEQREEHQHGHAYAFAYKPSESNMYYCIISLKLKPSKLCAESRVVFLAVVHSRKCKTGWGPALMPRQLTRFA